MAQLGHMSKSSAENNSQNELLFLGCCCRFAKTMVLAWKKTSV